ncbi:MAG TPA: glycoside hydrolase family 15 protein, partial [Chthoniobacterales bacterium]|nr:glycoside hydrolase family 15 protein [Chthoniobacterales bacterium]
RLVPERGDELRKTCEAIRAEVLAAGVKTRDGAQVLAAMFENAEIDAASLLAFTSDFLPADLARATRQKVEEVLGEGELTFRNETLRAQGEGAFLLCSFWLVNHLIKEGEIARAQELLDGLLRRASPLGLLSEEIDSASGNFLGNFPQAFSHLGLIGTILNLDLVRRRPESARWSDHERFAKTVGPTVGLRGVLAGFWRVPKTLSLLFVSRSKWRA